MSVLLFAWGFSKTNKIDAFVLNCYKSFNENIIRWNKGLSVKDEGYPKKELKGAIVYLLNEKDFDVFQESIASLDKNFFYYNGYNYPVFVFYEELPFNVSYLISMLPSKIDFRFLKIKFSFPPNYNAALEQPSVLTQVYPGYNHMIRFWFKSIFEHPDVKNLDYYWRMDADSRLESPIKYDIFQAMHAKKLKYGFVIMTYDNPYVTKNMSQFMFDFIMSHPQALKNTQINAIHIDGLEGIKDCPMPMIYNNFEIVHIPSFISSSVIDFVNNVDATSNIYRLRWGDAPLRFFQLLLFFDISLDVGRFCSFDYFHGKYHKAKIKQSC